jgi:hypothetical protein
METWRIVLLIVIVLVVLVGTAYTATVINKAAKKRMYVYPKTKRQYRVQYLVKMKDTCTGEWTDAILYYSFSNGHLYVREKNNFFDKFVTLEELEKSNGSNKKGRLL